jgi:hypothetical protein
LLSYVMKLFEPRPSIVIPLSSIPAYIKLINQFVAFNMTNSVSI